MKLPYKKNHFVFHDASTYASHISQGIVEHQQLEPGSFYGELKEIISKKVIVSTHRMNRIIQQTGSGIEGYTTFLLPGDMSQDFSWRKQRLTGHRVGVLKSGMEHFAITLQNFFGTPISLLNKYFNELIIKLKFDQNLYKIIQQNEVIEINPEDAYKMQKIVIELCNSEKVDMKLLTNKLPLMLLKSIERICDEPSKQISNPKDILFIKSLNYILLHLEQKINTNDLCTAQETSERNLRYVFKEMTGLSPMKYIKSLKLNKARKDILNFGNTKDIGVIANNCGFSHSGQFAADYKKLFGEFPSETMGRIETKSQTQ